MPASAGCRVSGWPTPRRSPWRCPRWPGSPQRRRRATGTAPTAALRDLLERLAATRPLVLCLDDVHWADPASVEALAALVRRPASGPVLLALAAREGQFPGALAAALSAALRDDRVTRLVLGPLSEPEAIELVGDAAAAIYPASGGNPFFLEQLARAGRARATGDRPSRPDESVPAAVAAALEGELAAADARGAPPARRGRRGR